MVNSYDNTILYLDFFLTTLIEKLKKENTPTVLIYVSDHGEYLGEEGKWLHAQGGEAAKNPAYFLWFSEKYIEKYPTKVNQVFRLKNQTLTTDIIFYQILDLLDITYLKD
jgi:glucan phosphoethanolaminetransferase (alkaline phosphatase superfamily)